MEFRGHNPNGYRTWHARFVTGEKDFKMTVSSDARCSGCRSHLEPSSAYARNGGRHQSLPRYHQDLEVTGNFDIEPLSGPLVRTGFSCGVPRLDRYFQENVTQDVKRRLSNCFYQGRGLGSALVVDAITRSEPAIFAMIVDAKDETVPLAEAARRISDGQ